MLVNTSEDIFNKDKSPEMVKELSVLIKEVAQMPVYFKPEIIISFLKNHSIKNDWIKANPELTEKMVSGSIKISHIESLFQSSRDKKTFLLAFENYIKEQLLLL